MMRIRGIKHNGELKMLINTPHTLVLREKVRGLVTGKGLLCRGMCWC